MTDEKDQEKPKKRRRRKKAEEGGEAAPKRRARRKKADEPAAAAEVEAAEAGATGEAEAAEPAAEAEPAEAPEAAAEAKPAEAAAPDEEAPDEEAGGAAFSEKQLRGSSLPDKTIALSFDASLGEIFRTLLAGGTLCLARGEESIPELDACAPLRSNQQALANPHSSAKNNKQRSGYSK